MSWRWKLSVLLVFIVGFSLLIFMGHETSTQAPPIPEKVVTADDKLLFTGTDILNGQAVFQKYGLMDVGSIFGHGAYNGPDFSAEYLHKQAVVTLQNQALSQYKKNYADLSRAQQGALKDALSEELKKNRYDTKSHNLIYSESEVLGFAELKAHYKHLFTHADQLPLPRNYIKSEKEIEDLTCFFSWAAWTCVTNRPDKDYTFTNNWPPDELVGNKPHMQVFLWSALSLISLIGGIGLTQFLLGAYPQLGWRTDETSSSVVDEVKSFSPSLAQKAVYPYLIVVVLLFLFQTMFGVVSAHYVVEPMGFFGLDIRSLLPYSITRSWHLQLSILWIATAWLAAGIFIAPLLSKYEPKGQHVLVWILLIALLIVAVGSICGEWLGVNDMLGNLWFWFGHQGWEYLELGRFWQILLTLGMVLWAFIVLRSVYPLLKGQDKGSLPHMLLYGVISIPVFFSFGMMYHPGTNFVIADFWRWWVVHLWVEGFFELYTTIIVAYFFHSLGMISARGALTVIYLDIILYMGSGIVGIGHHYYWTAQPAINMALGAMFSALEVVPLTLLTVEAWKFVFLAKVDGSIKNFSHYWAMMFLIAVGFWNFLGAGVFGFLINMPIVSYYEHATYLTSNHGHAALMGVYGNLGVAAVLFCSRYLIKPEYWSDKLIGISFWCLNIGLLLMLALNIFPAGVLQMAASYTEGFWYARSYEFTHSNLFQTFTWLRVLGDITFVIGGILPLVFVILRGTFHLRKAHQERLD
ncbi:nitric-oxide reductase large subunit [bacterium]|nr:nitric-oxide reductase large subunit [bacterium]QQR56805.1 MAG: nitric-oxide reductase large subunit [Candidatus Melainabacteria bacterium]